MTALRKILRYQLSISVGAVAAIFAITAIIVVLWPAAPWWVFVIAGTAVGVSPLCAPDKSGRSAQ